MSAATASRASRRGADALVRRPDGTVVCSRCKVADTAPARMKGLLGRKSLPAGEGVLLRPAPSVQTFFMRFPIDVVFLDREGTVVKVVANLKPWRSAGSRKARAALELAPGEAARRGVEVGERLLVEGAA